MTLTVEDVILKRLQQGPARGAELMTLLKQADLPFSRRVVNSACWKLAEEGRARFNDDWLLESTDPAVIPQPERLDKQEAEILLNSVIAQLSEPDNTQAATDALEHLLFFKERFFDRLYELDL